MVKSKMKGFASVFCERSNSQEGKNNGESKAIGASKENVKYMSNDENPRQIDIEELFTESSCSENEDFQSTIITSPSDIFDIFKEEA